MEASLAVRLKSQKSQKKIYHPIYDELSFIVSKARKRAEEEEINLAEIVGVHPTTLWRWERKLLARPPRPTPLMRLLFFESGARDLNTLVGMFNGHIRKTLQKMAPADLHLATYYPLAVTRDDIKDFTSYLAVKLVYARKTLSRERLLKTLALAYVKEYRQVFSVHNQEDLDCAIQWAWPIVEAKVNRLVSRRIFHVNKDGHFKGGRDYKMPTELFMEYGPKMFLFVDPDSWGVDEYFCRANALSGSPQAVSQAIACMFDAYVRAVEIVSSSHSDEVGVELLSFVGPLEFFGQSQNKKKGATSC